MFDKSYIAEKVKINEKDIITALPAKYFGGILKFSTNNYEEGSIGLTNDTIIFINMAIFKKNQIVIIIPIKNIIYEEIAESEKEDLGHTNFMTSMTYFAGKGAVTSFKKSVKLIKIPYKDEKGIKQSPIFSIKKIQEFGKLLYEKIPKKSRTPTNSHEEDPLKILKLRYAKGEVSKKEYEQMKTDLS